MNLLSLDKIFTDKLFRIPDYQRGYAWRTGTGGREVVDFWEDLLNLVSPDRKHYTGVLTLEESDEGGDKTNSEWLLDDGYKIVHVVDGQQRLTTTIILIKAFCDFYRSLNPGKGPENIIIWNTKRLSEIEEKYISKVAPDGVRESFIFGYEKDNPSDAFLKQRIFGRPMAGKEQESFYTRNLENAKSFFDDNLKLYYETQRRKIEKVDELFKRLTTGMVFNVFEIDTAAKDFDIYVAFETMNNRGRDLSKLELLKNRLIYLTTLLPVDFSTQNHVRNDIVKAWKDVYEYLGMNKEHPLNDDDFLFTHWVMYFPYSRKTGSDYIRFLLEEKFTTKNISAPIIKIREDYAPQPDAESLANMDEGPAEELSAPEKANVQSKLTAKYIRDYVTSLSETVKHWYSTWFPEEDLSLTDGEKLWLDRLNRIGIAYFRPLVTAALMKDVEPEERVNLFKAIERFIFVVFRSQPTRSNYRSSEFYSDARKLLAGEISIAQIISDINARMSYSFKEEDGVLYYDLTTFRQMMSRKFNDDWTGYYGWGCRWYFLYEYESYLAEQNGNRRAVGSWQQFIKSSDNDITIEHIYPQSPTKEYWTSRFGAIPESDRKYFQGSIGNLLLLSRSINASLQDDGFDDKKKRKENEKKEVLRLGYENGSYSEVEVSKYAEWTPEAIGQRGMDMMKFMTKRWDLPVKDEAELKAMLFLPEVPTQSEES